jgi:hypothetical protein
MNKPAPEHLAAAGREVWVQMQAAYLLDPNEERLLLEACRTADELERLQAALRKAKTLAAGSMGQAKANPLFAELRLHRATRASTRRRAWRALPA